jgi:hypothetical protein
MDNGSGHGIQYSQNRKQDGRKIDHHGKNDVLPDFGHGFPGNLQKIGNPVDFVTDKDRIGRTIALY